MKKKNLSTRFARIAAVLRRLESEGAMVTWNARVCGQKFDAAIRSTYDDIEFLIVSDCLDFTSSIAAKTVKLFAKKVAIAGAHFGLIVASTGYTQEAFELSGEYPVFLLDSSTMGEMSDETLADTFRPSPLIYNFRFLLLDGSEVHIPEDPPLLKVLMQDIKIKGDSIDTYPQKLVEEVDAEMIHRANGRRQTYEIGLPEDALMVHPSSKSETRVTAFKFDYRLIPKAELINPDAHYEDRYGVTEASQREELAKRNPSADYSRTDAGFDTILRPSRYYYNPKLRFSYYCEAVKKGQAKIVVVESYLERGLLQARGTISSSLYGQFVEVIDQHEIARLTKLYDKFSFSDKNLEGRIKVFLSDWEEAESIDDLDLSEQQQKRKKADYFFRGRTIIGELKALYEDTASKIEHILAPYRESSEWPLLFGEQSLENLLQHLSNATEIRGEIFDSITSSIEGAVENANRQIRTTKETFGLPDAGGLLIILNDAVDILAPDLIVYRVRKSLNKRTPEGRLRFPHVSAVVVIGGAHYSPMKAKFQGIPIVTIPTTAPEADRVADFISVMNTKWSEYDRRPLFSIEAAEFSKLTFRSVRHEINERSAFTQQDYWNAMYRRAPYLRSLDEEPLLDFGVKAFEDVSVRLLKGAPKIPDDEMERIIIKWSNFLDEANHRGTDMKRFVAKLKGLDERLEQMYQEYQGQAREQFATGDN